MLRALVVDDHAMVREPMEALLAANGYCVSTATNGFDALLAVAESLPDDRADVSMPGWSGVEFLTRLRLRRAARWW